MSQDFTKSTITSGSGGSGGRGGDVGSHNTNTTNSNNNTVINYTFNGPQFIVSPDGKALDLSMSDFTSVLSYPFHGGKNQQWFVEPKQDGTGVSLSSKYNNTYVGLNPNNTLVSSVTPFFWHLKSDEDDGSFRFAVPGSDQGLSLKTGTICPLSAPESKLYVMENTPDNIAAIQSNEIVRVNKENADKRRDQRRESQINPSTVVPEVDHDSDEAQGQRAAEPTTNANFCGGINVHINVFITDASAGSTALLRAINEIKDLLFSNESRNINIFLGESHRQNSS